MPESPKSTSDDPKKDQVDESVESGGLTAEEGDLIKRKIEGSLMGESFDRLDISGDFGNSGGESDGSGGDDKGGTVGPCDGHRLCLRLAEDSVSVVSVTL